jgi:leucyl-tRNA synthetase
MEFTNHFTTASERPRSVLEKFVLLLCPFAPHIAEELWQALGHKETLAHEPWPEFNADLAKEDAVEVPVQIDGKVRLKLQVDANANDEQILALAREKIPAMEWWTSQNLSMADLELKKVVPGRLISFVTRK